MTRMIPSVIHPSVKSRAERRLFDTLRDAPGTEDWVCLHSLGLARHDFKRRGEIDFLLLTRRGVFVLEVKGGRISRHDGLWIHTDRFGQSNTRHESPFDQASGAMFSLEREIKEHFSQSERMRGLLFGYGVMMPDVEFEHVGVEADRRLVYDCRDRRAPISAYVDRLSNFARERAAGLRYAPTADDIGHLVSYLRPDFDLVPSLSVRVEDASVNLLSLAEEQYAILDAFDAVPRLIVQGGAGTGKTLLAMECCARESRVAGRKVLLLCYNRLLAAALAAQASARQGLSQIEVKSVYGFMAELVAASSFADEFARQAAHTSDQERYEKLFPEYAQLAAMEGASPPWDVLVLDEAQDIMSEPVLDVIDACIAGGFESGRWRVFCDVNNQGAVYGHHQPDALDRLMRFGQSTLLSTNRRNTRQVADETTMLSSPRVPSVGVVSGIPVEYAWYDSHADQSDRLCKALARLQKQGIAPGQITLLSARKLEDCCAATMQNPVVVPLSDENIANVVAGRCGLTTYATVSSFKGLENDFIVLTDIDNLQTEWWKSVVYVGMSRARVGLCMLLNSSLRATYESCLREWVGNRN